MWVLYIEGDGWQLTIQSTAGVRRELYDQYIAVGNGNPQWSTKAIVSTVREIEHHDAVSSGIFADKFRDKRPQEWTQQALQTLEEATGLYLVDVIAKSHL